MTDYIKQEKFRNHIVEITNDPNCPLYIAATIEQYIDDEPAADVAPIVHGKWMLGNHRVRCSVCNTRALINYDETNYFDELSPYCPWCGAKMDAK